METRPIKQLNPHGPLKGESPAWFLVCLSVAAFLLIKACGGVEPLAFAALGAALLATLAARLDDRRKARLHNSDRARPITSSGSVRWIARLPSGEVPERAAGIELRATSGHRSHDFV